MSGSKIICDTLVMTSMSIICTTITHFVDNYIFRNSPNLNTFRSELRSNIVTAILLTIVLNNFK
jgi:hypothetical protein